MLFIVDRASTWQPLASGRRRKTLGWSKASSWFATILALWLGVGHAAALSGKVVGVADGDTLTVLDAGNKQHKVRLVEIDAPEKKQPFGDRSRQSLADLSFGKVARVITRGEDRFGRTLGRVYVGQVDVNAEQVRRGMAWVFDRYATDRALYAIQDEARLARRGLWADPNPIPPWKWRSFQRSGTPRSRSHRAEVEVPSAIYRDGRSADLSTASRSPFRKMQWTSDTPSPQYPEMDIN